MAALDYDCLSCTLHTSKDIKWSRLNFGMNLRCLKSFLCSFTGLEEFEDKVDKIASGQDDDSWIGQIYNTFSSNFGMDGSKIDDSELGPKEGLEPPILDETWGLEDVRKLHETDEGMTLTLKIHKNSHKYNMMIG